RGYFRQRIDADGQQQHLYPNYDFRRLPVLPVTQPNGRRVRVSVDFPGRQVHLRLWKATVGRVPVILLDSDVRENDPADRPITSILYVRGREMRLCQEVVLGVGGALALRALGIEPSAWHINEGHSALLAIQRLQDAVERDGATPEEALQRIPQNALFTTHTPVPAGNETFDVDLVRKYLEGYAGAIGVTMDDVLALGDAQRDDEQGRFNLTALAIRTSTAKNGVSELHGRVANDMWRHLWPGEDAEAPVVGHITNGVHLPTWLGPEMSVLLRDNVGERFADLLAVDDFAGKIAAVPDEEVWTAHLAQKSRLVLFAREKVREQFARHGRAPDELRQVNDLLDPEALTIGFARRFATYKRAALIFRDAERLRQILTRDGRPVQLVFAGKAHPADRPGQDLIRDIFQASLSPELRGRIVFLEDYDIQIARHLVQGVDLWLNTPLRPLEASGTSGMKAALNGGLNFSVLDGWWCEGYDPSHGWVIGE
ncbi:MAG: alpha-glucan family phosphorylase, partial [Acidobacteriota bacterium]|nr:alpha-glucan family phosphorylase [Acidobacteriota bacterium]